MGKNNKGTSFEFLKIFELQQKIQGYSLGLGTCSSEPRASFCVH